MFARLPMQDTMMDVIAGDGNMRWYAPQTMEDLMMMNLLTGRENFTYPYAYPCSYSPNPSQAIPIPTTSQPVSSNPTHHASATGGVYDGSVTSSAQQARNDPVENLIFDHYQMILREAKNRGPQPSAFICSVPKAVRELDKSDFTPSVISIGPLHKGRKRFLDMEIKKLSFIQTLFSDTESNDTKIVEPSKIKELIPLFLNDGVLKEVYTCYVSNEDLDQHFDMTQIPPDGKDTFVFHQNGRLLAMNYQGFAETLFFDGSFVLQLLISSVSNETADINSPPRRGHASHSVEGGNSSSGPLKTTPVNSLNSWEVRSVKQDLLLLENQVPYFVLNKLYRHLFKEQKVQLTTHIYTFFKSALDSVPHNNFHEGSSSTPVEHLDPKEKSNSDLESYRFGHILDIIYQYCVPWLEEKEASQDDNSVRPSEVILRIDDSSDQVKGHEFQSSSSFLSKKYDFPFIYSASELNRAGVKFRVKKDAKHLLDVDFIKPCCFKQEKPNQSQCCNFPWLCSLLRRPILAFPNVKLNDTTKLLLRNLNAYEQCSSKEYRFFSQYSFIMDKLANENKDLQILVEAEILENNLGTDKEVLDFFTNLSKEGTMSYFHFAEPWTKVNDYYKGGWPQAMVSLKINYFSNTWVGVATIAACFLLLLTTLQTVFTLLQYYS